MSGVNKVIVVGNLGNDPQTRSLPNGDAVTNISVATSESWKDATGNKQERTEWHNIVVRNKAAEICEKYLKKGDKVYIEGRLKTRKWQDDKGHDRYSTEIQCVDFTFLTPKSENAETASEMKNKVPADNLPKTAATQEQPNDLPF